MKWRPSVTFGDIGERFLRINNGIFRFRLTQKNRPRVSPLSVEIKLEPSKKISGIDGGYRRIMEVLGVAGNDVVGFYSFSNGSD